MDILNEINKIKNHYQKIIWIAVLVMLFSFLFSLVLPLKYRSSAEVLIIQKQTSEIDPYTSAKSAERTAETLTKVIYSSSFFDKVLRSGYKIEESSFSKEEVKKRKDWKKTIETQIVRGTGIIKINVYHKKQYQAEQIASGIVYVLERYGQEFHGGGDFIKIKTIDYPLTSKNPVKPNLILNVIFGFAFGLILGTAYVFLYSDDEKKSKGIILNKLNKLNSKKTALASEVAPRLLLFSDSKKSPKDSGEIDKEIRKKLEKFRKNTDKWSI
jgi:capsular polysaccharide biosynthesis protein